MKIYKALVEGKNCWANLDGTCRRLGFFTARVAKGADSAQAAAAIKRKLTEELGSILLNKPEDVPEITMGELCEIDEETAREVPGTGCTWYPDEYPSPN
jgi:hypothetical protein